MLSGLKEEGKWDLGFIPENADPFAALPFAELARKRDFDTRAVQKMRDIEHRADEACIEANRLENSVESLRGNRTVWNV